MPKYKLNIPLFGNDEVKFYSKTKLLIANGYTRVVIGKRGPYVEFSLDMMCKSSFKLPPHQEWRLTNSDAYYIEFRSIDSSYIKIYRQLKLVSYADYKVDMFYISPLDLIVNDIPCIELLPEDYTNKATERSSIFFAFEDTL